MRLLLVLLVVARVWSTALHTAALRGDEAALLTHFQRLGDGDVDSMDSQQQLTPLHVACLKGHVAAARLLMKHGASVTRVDGRGMSPLHLAALSGSAELAEALLINGAAVDTVETAQNGTALHLAATHAGGCAVASVLLYVVLNNCEQALERLQVHAVCTVELTLCQVIDMVIPEE